MRLYLVIMLSFTLIFSSMPAKAQIRLNPSIFLIINVRGNYSGTAFQLRTRRGPVVITNKHVCQKNMLMFAVLTDSVVKLLVVKKVSTKYDLCILSPLVGVPELILADDYKIGDVVSVDGYPLAKRTFVIGNVGEYQAVDVTDNPIIESEFIGLVNNGSSGSPVIDLQGKVIGVINLKIGEMRVPDRGLFVPLELLKDFLETSGY